MRNLFEEMVKKVKKTETYKVVITNEATGEVLKETKGENIIVLVTRDEGSVMGSEAFIHGSGVVNYQALLGHTKKFEEKHPELAMIMNPPTSPTGRNAVTKLLADILSESSDNGEKHECEHCPANDICPLPDAVKFRGEKE